MKSMLYIDANVILRYLLADEVEQHIISKNLIEGVEELFILEGVVVEIVYVLTKTYGIDRKQTCDKLVELFEQPRFFFENKTLILEALTILRNRDLDFVDCMLCALKKFKNAEVFTFDKKLLKCFEK